MLKKNSSYGEIAAGLLENKTVLIFPHMHADGDALGSTTALAYGLRSRGIEAYVVISEDIPGNLDFLDNEYVVRYTASEDPSSAKSTSDPLQHFRTPGGYDLAVMVDCGGLKRIKGRDDLFLMGKAKCVIDHHGTGEDDVEFDFGIVEPDSAATAELIFLILDEMGVEPDKKIADALWTGITTDTGNFQHTNTSPRSHELAARLHRVEEFNCKEISNLIYNRNSYGAIKLESMVMEASRMYAGGKVVIGRVIQDMLDTTGTDMSETDPFIQKLCSIDGVEVACLLKEYRPNNVKVSLRSKGAPDVDGVAAKFDGGGHKKAAGCVIRTSVPEAERIISEELIKIVE